MKAKSKATTVIFGAVSLLILTVAMSYGDVTCPSGKITAAGSGLGTAATAAQRYVFLQCNTTIGSLTLNTPRRFKLLSTYDQDGKYATALTALALTNDRVRFIVSGTGTMDSVVYLLEAWPATY